MKRCLPLVLLLVLICRLNAREIDIRLWISGGMQGLVIGNRECPGWLSVSRQLALEDPGACWIQLGAPPVTDQIEGLKTPDAVIPIEADFRLQGLAALEGLPVPLSLLNVTNLPQFPDYRPRFASLQIWRQADGVEVHVFGLLSDQAPLRIHPDRLRPLQVSPALAAIRQYLTEHPLPDNAFPVLVLPEDADPSEWSAWVPEFPLLIQAAGAQAKSIEVRNGSQLRVQPARFGRALLRVQVYWDTVERRFRDPTAETVWVNPPDLHGLDLPAEILQRLRPQENSSPPDWHQNLIEYGDAALLPEEQARQIDSMLPDAQRVSTFPEDHAWLRVQVSKDIWNRWKAAWSGPHMDDLPDGHRGEIMVLLPGHIAAGNGDGHSLIRKDLETLDLQTEWLPFTSRDLILPLDEKTP